MHNFPVPRTLQWQKKKYITGKELVSPEWIKQRRDDLCNVVPIALVLADRAKHHGGSVTLKALSYVAVVTTAGLRNFLIIGLKF